MRKEVLSIQRGFKEAGEEFLKVICTDLSEVESIDHGMFNSSPKIHVMVFTSPDQNQNSPYLIGKDGEKKYTLTISARIYEILKQNGCWSQSGAIEMLGALSK